MNIEINKKREQIKKLVKEIKDDPSINEDDKETVLSGIIADVNREYVSFLSED